MFFLNPTGGFKEQRDVTACPLPPPSTAVHLGTCHQEGLKLPEAHLRDTVGSVPDPSIKRVTQIFWFPSVCKSYVYTML